MRVVDDDGRLFGLVNVVDAMVALLLLAVVVGGAALVVGDDRNTGEPSQPSDPSDPPMRFATVSYTAPLESDAARLQHGETMTAEGDNYDVIDVHRTITPGGDAHITARLAYSGEFSAGGNRLYGGDGTDFTTDAYRISGHVRSVNGTDAQLSTETTNVVMEVNTTAYLASTIEPGTNATVGGETVGTITAVENVGEEGEYVLHMGVELGTRQTEVGQEYGGKLLRVGTTVTLVTDEAIVSGDVVRVGTDDPAEVSGG